MDFIKKFYDEARSCNDKKDLKIIIFCAKRILTPKPGKSFDHSKPTNSDDFKKFLENDTLKIYNRILIGADPLDEAGDVNLITIDGIKIELRLEGFSVNSSTVDAKVLDYKEDRFLLI